MERSTTRVLVLDDEPFILKLHAHMLKELGFPLTTTFDAGERALAHMDAGLHPPNVILLDLSMPAMDGIQFIRQLVERGYEGDLILVSGEDARLLQSAVRLVEAHGIRILGHIAKPVKPVALSRLLDKMGARSAPIDRTAEKSYSAEEISEGLRRGEFFNQYQPSVSLRTGVLEGVEALVRWRHPVDGLVPPGRFIPTAETHGLIGEMTQVVFNLALREVKALESHGLTIQVAINLAMPILTSIGFADYAIAEAARVSFPAQSIVFEVTESQLMGDVRAPLDVVTRLYLARFRLSIDDFGTGYSSFAQLRDIPFGELKIDQSFVHRAATDPTARAIFDASLNLGRTLKMKTIAEGVEDQADWDLVQAAGCDAAQGYFIGRPMEAAALPAWTVDWRKRFEGGIGRT